ncbi:MAG: acetate kinase [Deferribacteraceae bacterium]|jgi:acetate kinase|nr:acetate kinase [Deferribacteraceae bacterium]
MKILALNCGSSSIKYLLYDWELKKNIVKGMVERIGTNSSSISCTTDTIHITKELPIEDYQYALQLILDLFTSHAIISAVAHRVVHGGEYFSKSVLIDDEVINAVKELSVLAPLHNPPNLEGIKAAKRILPDIPHVAIFDTAFHQTMPKSAYMYAVPIEWYAKHKIRRYGFHGTSHLYLSKRAAKMLKKPASECNLITLHMGNGVSVTAIKNGMSVDTSMGLTPLEGVVMGSRAGDIDPSIPLHMQNIIGLTPDEMYMFLNRKSGVYGICGYLDMRDVMAAANRGDELCELAIEIKSYRLRQYIGKYLVTLGRLDAIVFTAGVGENSPLMRRRVLEGLENFGIIMDRKKNEATFSGTGETDLSAENSIVRILMIPTNEEQVLIEDTVGVLNGNYSDHMSYGYTFGG